MPFWCQNTSAIFATICFFFLAKKESYRAHNPDCTVKGKRESKGLHQFVSKAALMVVKLFFIINQPYREQGQLGAKIQVLRRREQEKAVQAEKAVKAVSSSFSSLSSESSVSSCFRRSLLLTLRGSESQL